MDVAEFDYELPPERIAQEPLADRDASRLMVLGHGTGSLEHRTFRELPDLLDPGDLLIVNDTRVIPARLYGTKVSGGRVEVLRLEPVGPATWRCLLNASRKPAIGATIDFGAGLTARILEREAGSWTLAFETVEGDVEPALEAAGRMPLPPYIRRASDGPAVDEADRERYQTVYARQAGAVAAPTAGLHFTEALLGRLRSRGVELASVTLHVGAGTFLPVRVDRVEDHAMHDERYALPEATAQAVGAARERGGRLVAVGTTVARTLEHCGREDGTVEAGAGATRLFIYPGYRFRVVDALITNFHLPQSTLLMLVAAFAGRERVLAAYREAVERGYRFYSYGDAMLLC